MVKIVQNVNVIVAVSILAILSIVQQIAARPKDSPFQNSLDTINGCHIDSKVQDTCQRCAKVTKSNVVYPLCCGNEDDVFVWCQRYLEYGIH
ncbi:uncharacterized protein LOC116180634 [Photinus pyralis]|uniref:uncharacterized protein LOC116180634 n=1 Tax=Photinus pyralis TaxID=7054 RepID=UPI00126761F6|nr:uncharacterized protein LOC116180634 [Photinus pyralis]